MRISIVGTVGVPAVYGGFETLVENLVKQLGTSESKYELTVYCSSRSYHVQPVTFYGAKLKYVPLNANGYQSILYDIWSMVSSARQGADIILLLGVSGSLVIPLIKMFSRSRVITNIDGIEWRRAKWGFLAKYILKISEVISVKYSDRIIADNRAIADYVLSSYGVISNVIEYGGDHAVGLREIYPKCYRSGYSLALCRIEPENNIEIILKAFCSLPDFELVFVGNWNNSDYGRELKIKYSELENIKIVDPVYDAEELLDIRLGASSYIHGHSAGGTNPALVEMMHFGVPVFAFDCNYNRITTMNKAVYFDSSTDLISKIVHIDSGTAEEMSKEMLGIARTRYTWRVISSKYKTFFDEVKLM